jgi:hypothetical protein
MRRQRRRMLCMRPADWENLKAARQDCLDDATREGKFPDRSLDPDLPHRNRADVDVVGGLGNRVPPRARHQSRITVPPEKNVSVEKYPHRPVFGLVNLTRYRSRRN